MKKKLSIWFSFALVLILILSGCSSKDPGSLSQSASSTTAKTSKKDLTIAVLSDATKLDPHLGTDIPSANVYSGNIYEGLVKQDGKMKIQPDLATSWKQIDNLTWEFKLRKGVKFTDGTPFTAEAVKKTIERVQNPKTASPRASLFKMIKEVKVVDDYTVQLITSYPFAPLLATLSHYSAGIISPKEIDSGANIGQNPVGTGPFMLKEWKPGQEIVLEKNPNYWGKKPIINTVTFKVVPEDSTRESMVETGEADIADPVPVTDIQHIQNSDKMKLLKTDALGNDYIGFNLQKKPFDNLKVRQAISYAIDTKAILKGVYDGVGTLANAPMGPKVFGYSDKVKGYSFNPDKAKKLLAEAGYPNGFKTTIWTNNNKERQDVAEVVQSQLKSIGIDVQVKVLEWGAYLDATAKGQQDMYILGWSNMTGDADYNQYFLFDSEAFGNPGNRSFYKNPAVDQLISQGRQESDPNKRKQFYEEAQKIEMSDDPMIFLRNSQFLTAVSNHVKGFWIHPSGLYMLDDVTIN